MFQLEKKKAVLLCIANINSFFFLSSDGRFKMKKQREGRSDKTWRLLLKRVAVARAMSSLASRKMPELVFRSWAKYRVM